MTPSTPTRTRALFERALRTVALLALAAAVFLAGRPSAPRDAPVSEPRWSASELADSSATALSTRLVRDVVAAAADSAPRRVHVALSALPSLRARALLDAVDAANLNLHWTDRTQAVGLALSATAVASPSGAIDVRVGGAGAGAAANAAANAAAGTAAGDRVRPIVLRDAGGTLDSMPAVLGAGWRLASVSPPLTASVGVSAARVALRSPRFTRRVMLVAQPGWESKFVAAALEESGWQVDGSLRISPRAVITLGAPLRLDTARYAVVVLLDSMSVDALAITRFVRQGGGLVLGGDALRIPSLAAIRPVRATATRGAVAGALLTDAPPRGLEAWELVANRGASVVQSDASDHGHAEPVLVAQRVGAGRVVASAYRNSWRWRMEGTDDGAAEHRGWWGSVLALAAGMPAVQGDSLSDPYPGDAAPYADLVARIGAPVPVERAERGAVPALSAVDRLVDRLRAAPGLLFMVIALALLGEWASRRLRGNR